jgi:hypothetical protein
MSAPPSATTFTTSDEAFKYPLPQVRQFQKQLQVALEEKNARLRTLVGGSYRQLLGTAEMIVDMRRDIEVAETKLARVAEGCSRSAVGKKVAGLGKLGYARHIDGADGVNIGWIARMKVLDGSVLVVGRLLRGKEQNLKGIEQSRGRRLIAAAKVLVLSRLLIKTLGDEVKCGDNTPEGADGLVEEMRKKLRSLRRRLLRAVERMLEKVDGDREDLIYSLCAYSLATSSGARDVLHHFLHIRGEAIAMASEYDDEALKEGEREEIILRALRLYTTTLLDTQALVPRRLSEALLGLKAAPLLKDETVRGLEGLELDISERWFGDEIMFFTPYIRHDELDGPQAVDMLKGWAKKGSEVLLQGFEKSLGRTVDFKKVVDIRTKILEQWIREGGKARGFDSTVMLDGLRKVVNDQMVRLLEARITKLHLVGTEIEAVLGSWTSSVANTQSKLWINDLLEIDLVAGAGPFKEAIISGIHGRDNTLLRVIKGYETWLHLVDDLVQNIEKLRRQRWNDDIDSLEDDDFLETRSTLLSKNDPQMLQEHMESSLDQAYKDLHQKIATLLATHNDGDTRGRISIFVLRILRDIRAALPKRPDLSSFGLSLVSEIHKTLVTSVSSGVIASFMKSNLNCKKPVGRPLWEGSPELPVQPSPSTFRFLHGLTSSMASAGSDLWSPAALSVLKDHLREVLGREWKEALPSADAKEAVQVNGHKDDSETPSEVDGDAESNCDINATQADEAQLRDILTQSLFDVLVLQHYLQPPRDGNSDNALAGLEEHLKSRIELTDPLEKRLRQASQEYWRRTSLLFGLLS